MLNGLGAEATLSRTAIYAASIQGRKDVVKIGQGDAIKFGDIDLTMQFRDWLGHYPMHCHNTVHEDHAMMLRWQVVP